MKEEAGHPLFAKVCLEDPTVAEGMARGVPLEAIIVALAVQKQEMRKWILELEAIAPRKIVVEGRTYVWRCPDALIPGLEDGK